MDQIRYPGGVTVDAGLCLGSEYHLGISPRPSIQRGGSRWHVHWPRGYWLLVRNPFVVRRPSHHTIERKVAEPTGYRLTPSKPPWKGSAPKTGPSGLPSGELPLRFVLDCLLETGELRSVLARIDFYPLSSPCDTTAFRWAQISNCRNTIPRAGAIFPGRGSTS